MSLLSRGGIPCRKSLHVFRKHDVGLAGLRCSRAASLNESSPCTSSHALFQHYPQRHFSDWTSGTDLLEDSLTFGDRPKIILDSYAPSGFDVSGMITKLTEQEESASGAVHMNGSILTFPHACFLWKASKISDITFESLAPAVLHRPKLDYLFLGADQAIPPTELQRIKTEFREKAGIVVEQLSVANAMGTFNILNGEDRPVAAALLLEQEESSTTSG